MTDIDRIKNLGEPQTDRKIRLLILNLYTEMGGGEHALCNMLSGFDTARVVPVMVFPHDGTFPRKTEEMGIETVIISYPVVMVKQMIVPAVFIESLRASVRIHRLLREKKIDVVQCSDLLSLLLLSLPLMIHRLPVVYSVIFFYEWTRMLIFNLMALMFVDVIVTNSVAVADDLREKTMMLSAKIETIHPGVDTTTFRPPAADETNLLKHELHIDPSAPLIGMIGRFDPAKGHSMFVQAASELHLSRPDLHFVVIGGSMNRTLYPDIDAYRRSVLREAAWLSNEQRIAFLPYRENLPSLLRGIDVLVCPSENEGFGLVVLEALASGVPVVLSRSVGAWEAVRDMSGVHTVDDPTPSGFAEAMLAALTDPATRRSDTRAILQRDFNWNLSSQRFGKLYTSLLSHKILYHHYSQWSTIL